MSEYTEQSLIKRATECGIPDYMHFGIVRWVLNGIEPGHFLYAVLCNDFMEACGRADDTNGGLLTNYAKFLYNYVPAACKGSRANCEQWMKEGGLEGMSK